MIDIDELRRLAQAALAGPDGVSLHWVKLLQDFQQEANPAAINELLDRLEPWENVFGHLGTPDEVGNEWHALSDRLETAERERDALRVRIEEMEKQEPVAWRTSDGEGGYDYRSYEDNENYKLEWDARNPNHIGWVEPLYTLPGAQPAPSFADAYQGAMEEVAIWKKRALEAEDVNRKFIADINGPTHMGEPVQNVPSVPDDVIEQAVSRFLSWKLPKDFHPDGGMVFIPTKGRGHDSPHWPCGTNLFNAQQAREMLRYVLAKAPEAKP